MVSLGTCDAAKPRSKGPRSRRAIGIVGSGHVFVSAGIREDMDVGCGWHAGGVRFDYECGGADPGPFTQSMPGAIHGEGWPRSGCAGMMSRDAWMPGCGFGAQVGLEVQFGRALVTRLVPRVNSLLLSTLFNPFLIKKVGFFY